MSERQAPQDVSPLELADDERIPVADRLWALLDENVMLDRDLRLLACLWAARALDAVEQSGGAVDAQSRNAIEVARRYAVGSATADELLAADVAAWVAVNAATLAPAAAAAAAAASAAAKWVTRASVSAEEWATRASANWRSSAVDVSHREHLADVRRVLLGGDVFPEGGQL